MASLTVRRTVVKAMRMPIDLADGIQALAEKEGRGFGLQCRTMLTEWLVIKGIEFAREPIAEDVNAVVGAAKEEKVEPLAWTAVTIPGLASTTAETEPAATGGVPEVPAVEPGKGPAETV